MAKAYILVNVDAGADEKVLASLRSLNGVGEVHIVLGAADLIVEVERGDIETVREVVYNKIRKIPQVRSTQTMTVIE